MANRIASAKALPSVNKPKSSAQKLPNSAIPTRIKAYSAAKSVKAKQPQQMLASRSERVGVLGLKEDLVPLNTISNTSLAVELNSPIIKDREISVKSVPNLDLDVDDELDAIQESIRILGLANVEQEYPDDDIEGLTRRAKTLKRQITEALDPNHIIEDFGDLPELPNFEDLELIEILNSKQGQEYLLLDESVSHEERDLLQVEPVHINPPAPPISRPSINTPDGYTGLEISFGSFDISDHVQTPSTLWIEYTLSTPTRIRVKVLSTRSLKVAIPVSHSKIHYGINWEEEIVVRVFALGRPANRRGSKDLVELWTGTGSFSLKEILLADRYKVKTPILISKENTQKFRPSDVFGQLFAQFELLPIPQPALPVQLSPVILPPVYVTLYVSSIRGIQCTTTCLLYLSFRLFSGDERTDTVPITYTQEFDAETGMILNPCSFEYSLTRTLPACAMQSPKPFIIELHQITPGGVNLLGLIRLPLNQLLQVWDKEAVYAPMSEYSVVDPLTGLVRGWIGASLGLGNWSDMQPKRPITPIVQADEEDEPIEIELPTVEEMSAPEVIVAQSTLQVTIHRACGLVPLLESLDSSDLVDIALDRGPNTFVTLDLFSSSDDPIQTPIVAYSFTPTFDYTIQITVECLDTDLIRWIKDGGEARGAIYHRVPRHLVLEQDSILLGTFAVPLKQLIGNGINREWFLVEGGGAVECSLSFDGYELGGSGRAGHSDTQLSIKIDKIRMDGIEESGSVTYELPGLEGKSHHRLPYHIDKSIDFSATHLDLIFHSSDGVYIGTSHLKLDELIRSARIAARKSCANNLKEPAFLTLSIINPDSPEWMDAKVQVEIGVKVERKKRISSGRDQSSYMSESFVEHISAIDEIVENEVNSILPEKNTSKAIKEQKATVEELKERQSIPVFISIERAVNLPLLPDPDGSSFQSPFVKSCDLLTMPPSSHVTITCPSGFVQPKKSITRTIDSQTSPQYSFQTSADIYTDFETLASLKTSLITFRVFADQEIIGVCEISLNPLFSGLKEIHGWYPILEDGVGKGQLMVQINPVEDLGILLRAFGLNDDIVRLDLPTRSKTNVGSEERKIPELANPKQQETYEWDGAAWVMKLVSASPCQKANAGEAKSICQTMNELDQLKSKMMNRLQQISPSREFLIDSGTQVDVEVLCDSFTQVEVKELQMPNQAESIIDQSIFNQSQESFSSNPFKIESSFDYIESEERSPSPLYDAQIFNELKIDSPDRMELHTEKLEDLDDEQELSEIESCSSENLSEPQRKISPPPRTSSKPPLPPTSNTNSVRWKELPVKCVEPVPNARSEIERRLGGLSNERMEQMFRTVLQ